MTTTYPGVYIKEQNQLSLSVSHHNTAVPAFAIDVEAQTLLGIDKAKRIDSYMDYQKLLTNRRLSHDIESQKTITKDKDMNQLNNCMRTYFDNGGGYCYLIQTDKLVTEVLKHDDITLLVAAGQNLTAAANILAQGNNLFAILDGPKSEIDTRYKLAEGIDGWHNMGDSQYAAAYYPWLTADWTVDDIPPSAAIAGAYCKNDRKVGVWKAPANIALIGVIPKYKVSDTVESAFIKEDSEALNMIRRFNNGPSIIWGARTLKGSEQYRYVPVRRLFNSVEKDIKDAIKVVMFEPNSQRTWDAVRTSVTNYLTRLWGNGALMGTTPEDAFFVQVGKNITMDQADIKQGKMIVKVGIAAARPAEFIILKFTQNVAQ